MSPGSGEPCRVTQAGGGWTEPSGLSRGDMAASQLLLGCLSEDVGPALPDIQPTWKSAFRYEMKVKSLSWV